MDRERSSFIVRGCPSYVNCSNADEKFASAEWHSPKRLPSTRPPSNSDTLKNSVFTNLLHCRPPAPHEYSCSGTYVTLNRAASLTEPLKRKQHPDLSISTVYCNQRNLLHTTSSRCTLDKNRFSRQLSTSSAAMVTPIADLSYYNVRADVNRDGYTAMKRLISNIAKNSTYENIGQRSQNKRNTKSESGEEVMNERRFESMTSQVTSEGTLGKIVHVNVRNKWTSDGYVDMSQNDPPSESRRNYSQNDLPSHVSDLTSTERFETKLDDDIHTDSIMSCVVGCRPLARREPVSINDAVNKIADESVSTEARGCFNVETGLVDKVGCVKVNKNIFSRLLRRNSTSKIDQKKIFKANIVEGEVFEESTNSGSATFKRTGIVGDDGIAENELNDNLESWKLCHGRTENVPAGNKVDIVRSSGPRQDSLRRLKRSLSGVKSLFKQKPSVQETNPHNHKNVCTQGDHGAHPELTYINCSTNDQTGNCKHDDDHPEPTYIYCPTNDQTEDCRHDDDHPEPTYTINSSTNEQTGNCRHDNDHPEPTYINGSTNLQGGDCKNEDDHSEPTYINSSTYEQTRNCKHADDDDSEPTYINCSTNDHTGNCKHEYDHPEPTYINCSINEHINRGDYFKQVSKEVESDRAGSCAFRHTDSYQGSCGRRMGRVRLESVPPPSSRNILDRRVQNIDSNDASHRRDGSSVGGSRGSSNGGGGSRGSSRGSRRGSSRGSSCPVADPGGGATGGHGPPKRLTKVFLHTYSITYWWIIWCIRLTKTAWISI